MTDYEQHIGALVSALITVPVPFAGALSDKVGRNPVMVVGLVWLVLAALPARRVPVVSFGPAAPAYYVIAAAVLGLLVVARTPETSRIRLIETA